MKYTLILIIALCATTIAGAQTSYRTDESVGSQIKNGTAPGMVIRKDVAPAPKQVQVVESSEPYSKLLKENRLPGVTYQKATAKQSGPSKAATQSANSTLASDAPVKREAPAKIPEHIIPSQQNATTHEQAR